MKLRLLPHRRGLLALACAALTVALGPPAFANVPQNNIATTQKITTEKIVTDTGQSAAALANHVISADSTAIALTLNNEDAIAKVDPKDNIDANALPLDRTGSTASTTTINAAIPESSTDPAFANTSNGNTALTINGTATLTAISTSAGTSSSASYIAKTTGTARHDTAAGPSGDANATANTTNIGAAGNVPLTTSPPAFA